MTRQIAVKYERQLRDLGVYKPYITKEGDSFLFESWPLTAKVTGVFDKQHGPMMNITVTDYSRDCEHAQVATVNFDFGADTVTNVAKLLISLHAEAYSRAKAQEVASCAAK